MPHRSVQQCPSRGNERLPASHAVGLPLNSALCPRLVEFSQVTSQELQNLVRRGESEQLEFKQSSAQFPRAGETLCAFMNGRGGQVLVGVRPDGSVVGQTIADKTFRIWLRFCAALILPFQLRLSGYRRGQKALKFWF